MKAMTVDEMRQKVFDAGGFDESKFNGRYDEHEAIIVFPDKKVVVSGYGKTLHEAYEEAFSKASSLGMV